MRFKRRGVVFNNPAGARERGIATVFQDLAVCDSLSVTRNVVLGREPQKDVGPSTRSARRRWRARRCMARRALGARTGRTGRQHLRAARSKSPAIARAMFFGSSVLILDEPTSALAVQAGRVLDHIVKAREQGQAVILITHNFRHALSVADDLTVLAQGRRRAFPA